MSDPLPDCGLYRTGTALPGREEVVPAGVLVYFHNHSEQGPPLLLTPHDNTHNRWRFHDRGWTVEDQEFISGLIALKPEGLYVNTSHIHITREEIIPEKTLIQLGYNRAGGSILFVAKFEDNAIKFPSRGTAFDSPEVQSHLEVAGFNIPTSRPTAAALH